MKEGAIKFNCKWIKGKPVSKEKTEKLNLWRNKLFELKLIGAYSDGTGYGNISKRSSENKFIITGSGTGKIKKLTKEHYCEVTEFNFKENSLGCVGPLKASSESLTHAAIYKSLPEINAVIHVHNLKLWKYLLNRVPAAKEEAEYGTPEMAEEMIRLLKEENTKEKKIIVLKGHKKGVISFAETLDKAGKIMLKYFEESE